MNLRYLYISFIAVVLSFGACKKDKKNNIVIPGTADFSRYIAVGNSTSAGYADGGLYLAGQQVAFPNLVAGQMKLAGGGNFSSPLFSADQANGSGYLKLTGYNTDGTPQIVPVTDKLAVRDVIQIPLIGTVTLYTKYSGDLNNYAVPGINLRDVTNIAYGNYNGYYERMLPGNSPTNTTPYLDFVTAKPFTFFTCWLGDNDVLGYATSDGTSALYPLTDKATFTSTYNNVITALTKSGAKGVVVTIPDVTVIPFFHYITVTGLIAAAQKINIAFTTLYIQALDANGNYVTRAATNADLIMLTFNTSQLGATVNGLPLYGLSQANPLLSKEVLDVNEAAKVKDYVNSYNTSIKAAAAANNLPVFDTYALLNQLVGGITQNGVTINTNFISGGFFSLDGTHFTPRGNAYVADQLINVINTKYGSNLPTLDISTYNAVKVQP
ncbi:SGNH/GDSL hydrolase family protein [Mucilaginibacter arboris]|uniref:G-D-S-L family lipolytic protein n=1 Tax=Mucilaginibacter arboris TaxID=2682090 RepID=A0A7K1SWX8_9SPHI|nr:SGNH/GDSL hydrolase family protein [Mucilaginibacter arboris]MVN21803.1 G-D-S-L family lipolytic protein [Mucilaginibacter arboris]